MLTISIGAILIWALVLSAFSFLIYQVFKKDPDYLSDDDSSIDDDIFYGAYLDVDPQFLTDNWIKQASTIQVALPLSNTPEGHIRAEVNHLKFINIPYNKILGYYDEESFKYKESKKQKSSLGLANGIVTSDKSTYEVSDAITSSGLGLFDGVLETGPDVYTNHESDSSHQQNFGNGGEFAGGGASGSWDDTPSSDSYTSESYSSDTSYYSSTWSSSDYSSGSSSYDSGSSDTSSSNSDTW